MIELAAPPGLELRQLRAENAQLRAELRAARAGDRARRNEAQVIFADRALADLIAEQRGG